MTQDLTINYTANVPISDADSLFMFNWATIPIFSIMVLLYAFYLYRSKDGRNDPYTLFTILACMVSLICKQFIV